VYFTRIYFLSQTNLKNWLPFLSWPSAGPYVCTHEKFRNTGQNFEKFFRIRIFVKNRTKIADTLLEALLSTFMTICRNVRGKYKK